MKEIIKTIIKDFHEAGIPKFIAREKNIPLQSGKIVVLIGPRRAGKTYMMYQLMSKIQDISNIIYINFEDERLELEAKDFALILDAYFELYPSKKKEDIYLFFDEIQEIKLWEKFMRRVYDTVSKNIFITGSSSKLLHQEIATSLRGRTITYEILPLSFREYIAFQNQKIDMHSTAGKALLLHLLESYIHKGGFPETVAMDKEIYEKSLRDYFEVMFYRDIIERNAVTNPLPLKLLLKKLLSNTAKEFSVHKIFNSLKSEGIKISKDSLYIYVDYCEDAYLLFTISQFSETLSKQSRKKCYSIDTGLSSLISFAVSKDAGRLFENIIGLELKRRGNELYFYKENNECDFIIKERDAIIEAIQVCYSLDEENREREINGLQEAMSRFNIKQGIIITKEQEEEYKNIKLIPAWKWLLKEEKEKIAV